MSTIMHLFMHQIPFLVNVLFLIMSLSRKKKQKLRDLKINIHLLLCIKYLIKILNHNKLVINQLFFHANTLFIIKNSSTELLIHMKKFFQIVIGLILRILPVLMNQIHLLLLLVKIRIKTY